MPLVRLKLPLALVPRAPIRIVQAAAASTIPGAPPPVFRPVGYAPARQGAMLPEWASPVRSREKVRAADGRLRAEWNQQLNKPTGIVGDFNESGYPTVLHNDPRTLVNRIPTEPPRLAAAVAAMRHARGMHTLSAEQALGQAVVDEAAHVIRDPADFRPDSLKAELTPPFADVPTPGIAHMSASSSVDATTSGGDYDNSSEHIVDRTGGKLLRWLDAPPEGVPKTNGVAPEKTAAS